MFTSPKLSSVWLEWNGEAASSGAPLMARSSSKGATPVPFSGRLCGRRRLGHTKGGSPGLLPRVPGAGQEGHQTSPQKSQPRASLLGVSLVIWEFNLGGVLISELFHVEQIWTPKKNDSFIPRAASMAWSFFNSTHPSHTSGTNQSLDYGHFALSRSRCADMCTGNLYYRNSGLVSE